MTTANKIKLAATILALILVIILIFQNRESVDTYILFFEPIRMPRALLLIITLLIGFGVGMLTTWLYYTRKKS